MQRLAKIPLPLLNAAKARRLKAGRLMDGGGLMLKVSDTGSASWQFRYARDGKVRHLGLGRLVDVSAKAARDRAAELRAQLAHGKLPHVERAKHRAEQRRQEARGVTVAEACADYLKVRTPSKSEIHARQWTQTLEDYVVLPLGEIAVADLKRADVVRAFEPLWQSRPETAKRTLGRLGKVLDRQIALGTVEHNVAAPGPIRAILGTVRQRVEHHAAMPYADVPALVKRLREVPSIAARALEFVIATAARSGEVTGAQWPEIDFKAMVWTVPGERMKGGRVHRVPLSPPALRILRDMRSFADDDSRPIFRGGSSDGGLSNMALPMLLRRLWGRGSDRARLSLGLSLVGGRGRQGSARSRRSKPRARCWQCRLAGLLARRLSRRAARASRTMGEVLWLGSGPSRLSANFCAPIWPR